jgi:hypothetical protein
VARDEVVDDVKLMVSELVTSGVVNSPPARDGAITLDVRVGEDIRCAVKNPGDGVAAATELDGAATELGGGRLGLRLVASLAERWGVERTRTGTQVWFETCPVRPTKRTRPAER